MENYEQIKINVWMCTTAITNYRKIIIITIISMYFVENWDYVNVLLQYDVKINLLNWKRYD